MGSINSRNGKLYLDFQFKGLRCREQTKLVDIAVNRSKLEKLLNAIELQISRGIFDYSHHFPRSSRVERFKQIGKLEAQKAIGGITQFVTFAEQWLEEKKVEWRSSQYETVEGILRCHLVPEFGSVAIGSLNKSDILAF
ncbi:MAG: DUF3596 domain-containing protein, partial [Endozoicomonadaceae bacterium]|nr:DUF3596 domain-containing protein [Endozoicomonadaceae bacterium]